MNEDLLQSLITWFQSQCNEQWGSRESVSIGTLDNPGWALDVRLDETNLRNQPFSEIELERSEYDWISCYIKNGVFTGVGGPLNLSEILQIF